MGITTQHRPVAWSLSLRVVFGVVMFALPSLLFAADLEYMVRENTTDTTAVSTTETIFGWNSQTHSSGTAITYSGDEFELETGKYLVMYAQEWETTDTTNNTRKEIQGRLQIDGVTATSGASQCYIRKSGGSQDCVTMGNAIIDVSSATASLATTFYKTDNNATGIPTRENGGQNGVQIIKLDDAWNFARYGLATTQDATTSTTNFDDVVWDTDLEEDAGFSRSGADITISTAGRYIVSYSLPVRKPAGETVDSRTELTSRLTLDGSEVQGTRVSTYLRGNESTDDGVLNYIGIIDVGAGQILNVEEIKTDGNQTATYQGGAIEIVQLPSTAETFIREATSGDQNPASLTEFAWDTTAHVDTGSFTIGAADSSTTSVAAAGDYLFFWTLQTTAGGVQRANPSAQLSVNDTLIDYGFSDKYSRFDGGSDNPGHSNGAFVPNMSADDEVSVEVVAKAAAGTLTVDHGAHSGLRLDTLFGGSGISITGTLYENDGVTPLGAGKAITAAVGTSTVSLHSTTTAADGSFVIKSIETSTIGAWATSTIASQSWYEITYGNGMFVAVGGGRVGHSIDGLNWDDQVAPEASTGYYGLAYGNGVFVAVGDCEFGGDTCVMYSYDGINWATTTAAGDDDSWSSLVYGDGKFVAVSFNSSGGDYVMTSEDGINWTTQSAAGDNDNWQKVTFGDGRYVAVSAFSGDDEVMYSDDGESWTGINPTGNGWSSLAFGNGMFVAGGSDTDVLMYSYDGINWATTTAAGDNDWWFDMTYANGQFVAVSYSGDDGAIYSIDGINWTTQASALTNNEWHGVAYGNGRFVAVGRTGSDRIMYADAGFGEDTPITLFVDENATTSSTTATTLTYGLNHDAGTATITADLIADTVLLQKPAIGSSSNEIFLSDADQPDGTIDTDVLFTATTSTTTVNADLRIASGTTVFAPQRLVIEGSLSQNGEFRAEQGTTTVTRSASYNVVGSDLYRTTLDVSGQTTSARGIAFNDDGTQLYVTHLTGDFFVDQWELSTPYDTRTAQYVGAREVGFWVAPEGVAFNNDGSKMYLSGLGQFGERYVTTWNLSTPYNVLGAGHNATIEVVSQVNSPQGVAFNDDGTKLYVVDNTDAEITEWSLSTAYDISTAVYVDALNLSSQETSPQDFSFNADGTKIFVVGANITEWDLGTAYDVSTGVYVGTADVGAQGIVFNGEGSKFYTTSGSAVSEWTPVATHTGRLSGDNALGKLVVDQGGHYIDTTASSSRLEIRDGAILVAPSSTLDVAGSFLNDGTFQANQGEVLLSGVGELGGQSGDDPFFDLTVSGTYSTVATTTVTGEYLVSGSLARGDALMVLGNRYEDLIVDQASFDLGGFEANATGLTFNDDGTKLFVVGTDDDAVDEWSLSTAYDVSTASYVDTLDVSAQELGPQDLAFNDDGTKLYVVGSVSDSVHEWSLSTAYDAATASYVDALNVSAQETSPYAIAFNDDGTKLYVVGYSSESVDEWSLSTPYDVSTGSYVDTLSTDITGVSDFTSDIVFNPAGTKMYLMDSLSDEVHEWTVNVAYDVSSSTYVGAIDVSSQQSSPQGITFNDDGTKFYIVDSGSDDVREWSMSVAYDVSTGSYVDALSFQVYEAAPQGMAFADNGTKLYVIGLADRVVESHLSTAYDVSTAVYVRALDVSAQESSPYDIALNNDGTKLFVVGIGNDAVDEWSLSTPYDVSSASYVDTLVVSPQESTPYGIAFNDDGTKLFVAGVSGDAVDQWDLSIPFDVSTGVYATTLVVRDYADSTRGLAFSPDGRELFIADNADSDIDRWALAAPYDIETGVYVDSFPAIGTYDIEFNDDGTVFYEVSGAVRQFGFQPPRLQGNLVGTSALGNVELGSTDLPYTLVSNASSTSLTITSGGELDASGTTLSITGDYTNAGTFLASSSLVVFTGTATQTASGAMTGESAFNDVLVETSEQLILNDNASTTNLVITAGGALNASGTTLSITGDYTNVGTFLASTSLVVFNGNATQTASGTMTGISAFNDMSVTNTSGNGSTTFSLVFADEVTTLGTFAMTGSTSARFTAGATSTFQNVQWDGDQGSPVYLRSSEPGTAWYLDVPGTQESVDYVFVQDSHASTTIIAGNSTDLGNNVNWSFETASISGTLYLSDGITPVGSGATVALVLPSLAPTTTVTDGSGNYAFTGVSGFDPDAPAVLFSDASSTLRAAVVTRLVSSVADVTGLDLYTDTLIVRQETTTPVGIDALATYDNGDDSDVQYVVSTSTDELTILGGQDLLVWTGDSFDAPSTTLSGSYTGNGTTTGAFITLTGSGESIGGLGRLGDIRVSGTYSAAGTHATTGSLTITDAGSFTAPNGGLVIGGSFTQNGSFDSNGATTTFLGDVAFDISSPVFRQSLPANTTGAYGLSFNDDGTVLFVMNGAFDRVDRWDLSVPYDLSTAAYSESLAVGVQEPTPYGLALKPDGTELYVIGPASRRVQQWTLGVPWDLASAVFATSSPFLTFNTLEDVEFSPDGARMYAVTAQFIFEYSLATPWDVSTAVSVDDLNESNGVTDITFSADGTKLYLLTSLDDELREYDLSTPWDVSTAVFSGTVFDIAAFEGAAEGVTFSADGGQLFIVGLGQDAISGFALSAEHSGDFVGSNAFDDVIFDTRSHMLSTSASTSNLTIEAGALLITASSTLDVSGSFMNDGEFQSNFGTVILSGSGETGGDGQGVFHDLTVTGTYTSQGTTTLGGQYSVSGSYARGDTALVVRNTVANSLAYRTELSVSSQETAPQDLLFNPDGTKLYVVGDTGNVIDEWGLSTPYDVSTGVYTDSLDVSAQETSPTGMAFNSDGTKLYVVGFAQDGVDEWNLSVPYDVSTGSYVDTLNVNAQMVAPKGIAFNADGTRLYVVGTDGGSDKVDEWSLSTPYDVSTGVYVDSLSVGAQESDPDGMAFNADGGKLYIIGTSGNVTEWSLATPYDALTALYVDRFDVTGQGGTFPRGVAINAAGSKLYSISPQTDTVYEFAVTQPTLRGNLTGDSAVGNLQVENITFPVTISENASTSDLTILRGGALNASGTTLSISGDYTNNGSFIASTSEVVFDGTSLQTASGTMTGASAFHDVRVTNTSGTNATTSPSLVFSDSSEGTGDLTINTPNVMVQFAAGATTTWQNLNLTGTSGGNNVFLYSTATDTPWYLDVTGTSTIEFVQVEGSDASANTSGTVFAASSTDAGGNTNWIFGAGGEAGGVLASEWNPSSWTLYDLITIKHENIDESLTDFPVYVDLADLSANFWATTPSAANLVGTDIRVTTDDGTPVELPRELVSASSTLETGELHFKADFLNKDADTSFRIWYNGTTTGDYATDATYGAENVWSNDYVAVLHLEDDSATATDSTGNIDFRYQGDLPNRTGTLPLGGHVLDGTGDFLTASTTLFSESRDELTYQMWLNADAISTFLNGLIGEFNGSSDTRNFWNLGNSDRVEFEQYPESMDGRSSSSAISTDTTYLLHTTVADGFIRHYSDGALIGSPVAYTNNYTGGAPTATWIGNRWETCCTFEFDGQIDEVRIASTTRSSAWIRAEYTNQSTTTDFYFLGAGSGTLGSTTVSDHDATQVENAFSYQNVTNGELFAFKLTPQSGTATITELTIEVRGAKDIDVNDFSNFRLFWDRDNDGELDFSGVPATDDQLVVSGGTLTIDNRGRSLNSNQIGTIVFSEDFLSTTTKNYLIVADWNAPVRGSTLTLDLHPEDIEAIDADGAHLFLGAVDHIQHNRENRGGGGSADAVAFVPVVADPPQSGGGSAGGGEAGQDTDGESIADDPDFKQPSSTGDPNNGFTNPERAYESDGSRATGFTENEQTYGGFGYGIPTGNQITGIEVKIDGYLSNTNNQPSIELSWDGGTTFTTAKSPVLNATSDTVYVVGGPSDLWGRTWSPSEFTNSNFRINIRGEGNLPLNSTTLYLDAIQVRVYHQATGGSAGGGGAI